MITSYTPTIIPKDKKPLLSGPFQTTSSKECCNEPYNRPRRELDGYGQLKARDEERDIEYIMFREAKI